MSTLPLWQSILVLVVLVPLSVVALWHLVVGAIGWFESAKWERMNVIADERERPIPGTEYQPRERIVDDRWRYDDRHDFARHARGIERKP